MNMLELIAGNSIIDLYPNEEFNPFSDESAFVESYLVGIQSLTVSSTVAILIDVRLSLYVPHNINTALCVFRDVSTLSLSNKTPKKLFVWNIGKSVYSTVTGEIVTDFFDMNSRRNISIISSTTDVYLCWVQGIGDKEGDIVDGDISEYITSIPWWYSTIIPIYKYSLQGINK